MTTDALPLTSPLHAPVTVAPGTRLPAASRTVTAASASVRLRLTRRLIEISATDRDFGMSKLAVTVRDDAMLTRQLPVPEQAPDHPAKVAPEAGVAVRVTLVP